MDIQPELRERVMNLLESQLVGALSTTSNGIPYSCLVSYRFTDDLETAIFATKRDRLKYRKMMENPNVSLLIDDRQNRMDDFRTVTSLSVLGTVIDTEGPTRERYMDLLLEKHPYFTDFVRASDTAVIEVSVKHMYIVKDFESVTKLTIEEKGE